MKKEMKKDACCAGTVPCGCRVESLVAVDDRGQLVLPKEIRDRAGIRGGDKLAIVTLEREGTVCCISLIRAEDLTGMVKGLLGPLMNDVLRNA